ASGPPGSARVPLTTRLRPYLPPTPPAEGRSPDTEPAEATPATPAPAAGDVSDTAPLTDGTDSAVEPPAEPDMVADPVPLSVAENVLPLLPVAVLGQVRLARPVGDDVEIARWWADVTGSSST